MCEASADMSMASAFSVALVGLEGRIVEVEADISGGLPRTVLVGVVSLTIYEARDRCKAAVTNSGHQWPSSLLTINLSPATLPKRGGHYDLAIVAAVLAAEGVFGDGELAGTVLLGELGLDGRVRPVRGVLPATLAAASAGFRRVIVPRGQAAEARLVEGIEVLGLASLSQLVALFRGDPLPVAESVDTVDEPSVPPAGRLLDLADVIGQPEAKWAAEVATAGRHHMLFHGPPGVGKTMIAQRVPGLLPDLTTSEALEVSAIHSLAGFALADGLITRPPFSDPHHSASAPSIIGGGQRWRSGSDSCAKTIKQCSRVESRSNSNHRNSTTPRLSDPDRAISCFVYGLLPPQESAANFVPVNTADDILHLLLGGDMIGL